MTSPLARRTVEASKILDYLLNEDHRLGRAKAAFFRTFGFAPADWRLLQEKLQDHPERNPIAGAIQTPYGMKYLVHCNVATPDGRDPCITTVWIAEAGQDARLVTAYPADRQLREP